MSTAIYCTDCRSITSFPNIGFGKDVKGLRDYFAEIISELTRAETLGLQNQALRSLSEVFNECSDEGWDGYEAFPISENAYFEAKRLIMNLPITIPMPEITPEPNGELALEWAKGSRQVFVASVSGKNEIVYAGLFGTNKTHGTEYFGDSVPPAILGNLKRLFYRD